MKIFKEVLLCVLLVLTVLSCDPMESQYEGPERLSIRIFNNSGVSVFLVDNWSCFNDDWAFDVSERVVENNCMEVMWSYVPDLFFYKDFIRVLTEKCSNAYLELYSYDASKREKGALLKRWELNDVPSAHNFFDEKSFDNSSCVTYMASDGVFTFTITSEDFSE